MPPVAKANGLRETQKNITPPQEPWQPHWPNPADLPYNYFNLMSRCSETGLADVRGTPAASQKIAIIGAGLGGLTVARELFRCGYENIAVFEAEARIGGRTYPVMPKTKSGRVIDSQTPFELGAMRIPFFRPEDGSSDGNSLAQYYVDLYGQQYQDFPNPGSPITRTGIYINEGFGPAIENQTFEGMLIWAPTADAPKPPTAALQAVHAAWSAWVHNIREWVAPAYGREGWQTYWRQIMQVYEFRTFRDVALLPRKQFHRLNGATDPRHLPANAAGDFGGLGLTPAEMELFYTIGTGDGSWGAFFDVAALYTIRTLIFGFATKHKLLGHIAQTVAEAVPLPPSARDKGYCRDSLNQQFAMPLLTGTLALPAMHLFQPVTCRGPEDGRSFFQCLSQFTSQGTGRTLMTGSRVRYIDRVEGRYRLTTEAGETAEYDHLVVTAPGWSLQMNTGLGADFLKEVFVQPSDGDNFWPPMTSWKGLKMSHNITSSKIFFKLKARFWEESEIPQVIVTDTFLCDVYGYALDRNPDGSPSDDPGVLLCSYTWEDDSNKLASESEYPDDKTLAVRALARLDALLQQSGLPKMSPFVDPVAAPLVWQWERQPLYRSCAKLYRAGSFDWNYAQLSWNQNHSRSKRFYFAGEFASLEGGWIEPAMIRAIDTVLNIVKNTVPETLWETVFCDYGMILHYPQIKDWRPAPPYASEVDNLVKRPVKFYRDSIL